ncbi:hypothetical protein Ocin01_18436 [Orchesella cincta]|uniref:Uncharacterized protein n=1 Tax=Orchesella cincta TaxID=48709 RepID=A0A1D2M5J2_ORCCI|nr:hypothetical protein Ocin01_18436 [Orchesella cincta]
MSSSTAKFVPTLGGRVWRLQRQGGQITSAVMESAGKSSSRSSFSSFSQRGSASFSTGCSSIGQGHGQQPKPNNSWAQRF